MIRFVYGDMFDSETEAIINTVNLVGVMGKGIALQFKERFPENFAVYRKACRDKTIDIGNSLVTRAFQNGREIYIVHFPTKKHWRNPSEYSFIEEGLINLRHIITDHKIKSISVPALGAGNGGLDWDKVKKLIVDHLNDIDCEVVVYKPDFDRLCI